MPAVRPLRSLRRPEAAPGLTPDPIQQNSLSRSRRGPSRPVTCSYWGTKNVSTQPGSNSEMLSCEQMFSAVHPTTDITKILRHVRFVPTRNSCTAAISVIQSPRRRGREERGRHSEAERLGGPEIDGNSKWSASRSEDRRPSRPGRSGRDSEREGGRRTRRRDRSRRNHVR